MTATAPVLLHRPDAVRLASLPPLAVYVHIPWCVRKCPYCDFNSHESKGDIPQAEYVDALVADLEALLPSVWGRRVGSVFIGGGTPSLLSPETVERILSDLRARLPIEPGAEVTMEANPGTVEAGRFRAFRAAGVNRISLGVQSFDDAKLAALGRIHSALEARRALEIARESFDNVNVDLMYGLPEQTLAEARADVVEALRWETSHVSAYQLTVEPNTVFYRKPPRLPGHDLGAEMQRSVEDALGDAGFEHYEISAFARPGRRARHNLNYWEFGDYLGLGAGAHGKVTFADRVSRHERVKQPREYLAAAARRKSIAQERTVSPRDLPFEFMLNALRLIQGFPLALFEARTGLPLSAIESALARAQARGFVARDAQRLRPTAQGWLFLNEALELFLPA
jgi:oxygen-independent coproporphyrinogen-3 oxidase